MGYMAIEVKRTDADVVRYQVEITDENIVRISTAHGEIYFPNGVEEDGVVRAPTGLEILEAAAMGLISGMIERSIGWEKKKAIRAAEQAVQPIVVGTE